MVTNGRESGGVKDFFYASVKRGKARARSHAMARVAHMDGVREGNEGRDDGVGKLFGYGGRGSVKGWLGWTAEYWEIIVSFLGDIWKTLIVLTKYDSVDSINKCTNASSTAARVLNERRHHMPISFCQLGQASKLEVPDSSCLSTLRSNSLNQCIFLRKTLTL